MTRAPKRTPLFAGIGPSWQHYVWKKVQPTGLAFHYSVHAVRAWIELSIDRGPGEREWNEEPFRKPFQHRADIEGRFGEKLIWQPLDAMRACRIYHGIPGRALPDRRRPIPRLFASMICFLAAISPWLDQLGT